MEISGKTAFVTGGASGIGLATAVALAGRGASLALVDISAPALEQAERSVRAAGAPRVTTHLADVAEADQVERAAREALRAHGAVEIVFANAGVGLHGVPLSQMRSVEARWIVDVNVIGAFETVRAFLPAMIARGEPGAFLITASMAGLLTTPGCHTGIYSGTKFAVAALAQGIRDECGDAPIQVGVVYPGPVTTNGEANSVTLRPAGGLVATALPDYLVELGRKIEIPAAAAAAIIVEGLEAGLPHIFTHPAAAEMAHRRYSEALMKGVEDSRRLASAIR